MSNAEPTRSVVAGRVVWVGGDFFKGKLKVDRNTNQPKLNKKNEQITEYAFGVAIPKDAFMTNGQWDPAKMQPGMPGHIMSALFGEAYKIYPSRQIPPKFAWKYKDGDGVNHEGKPFPEAHKGCFVFTCATTIRPTFFKVNGGQYVVVTDDADFYPGCYVHCLVTIAAHAGNGPNSNPGIYINPNNILWNGHGERIINSPSGEQLFGAAPPPMMGSAQPLAPVGGFNPPQASVPTGAPIPFGQPAPQNVAPQMIQQHAPPVAPAPHYGVLPPQHQPQMGNVGAHPVGAPSMVQSYPSNMPGPAPTAVQTPMPSMTTMPVAGMPNGVAPTAFPSNGMPPFPGQQ